MSFHNMNEEDFGSDDSSDEDYVPGDGGPQVSEEEDSGDDEGKVLADDEEDGKNKLGKRRKTATKKSKKLTSKEEILPTKEQTPEKEKLSEESDKKRADMLWADFMKDVGGPVKSSNGGTTQTTTKAATPSPAQKTEKVTIVKEYNFAGETVKVSTEVDADSKEAEEEKMKPVTSPVVPSPSSSSSSPSLLNNRKRPSSGLSGLLDKLQKKPKMSILDKSKLDWNSFKSSEGITEELEQHNRGKNGYLEKVAFLERADYKQYEIERDMRMSTRKPT